jgi:hypothetical protein
MAQSPPKKKISAMGIGCGKRTQHPRYKHAHPAYSTSCRILSGISLDGISPERVKRRASTRALHHMLQINKYKRAASRKIKKKAVPHG